MNIIKNALLIAEFNSLFLLHNKSGSICKIVRPIPIFHITQVILQQREFLGIKVFEGVSLINNDMQIVIVVAYTKFTINCHPRKFVFLFKFGTYNLTF